MSKTASPALYELIKSLTKSEKRYFKIYASRHTIGEVNNGIRIFDFIDQQEEFDEEALYTHFKGEAFLNQFPITKNRLYEQIISALDAFHAKNDIDRKSTRLNSNHVRISYAVFCLKKKKKKKKKKIKKKKKKKKKNNLKIHRILNNTKTKKKRLKYSIK